MPAPRPAWVLSRSCWAKRKTIELEFGWPLPDDLDFVLLARKAGEKCFVVYCGQIVSIIPADTGETRVAEDFVAVLRTSSKTFAETTWIQ